MNKKITESLWLMANKMRGSFDVTELCKVMIYSLFLEYIRLEKDDDFCEVFDDKFTVGYLALTYGKMVGSYHLAEYVSHIERQLGLENSVVADEIERLIGKANEEVVRNIFGTIASIDFESKEQLYDVALMLISKLSDASGKMGTENFTNYEICKLEAGLLNCQDGMSVYDGFCGSGISVNEVVNNKGIVYLQDINVSTMALATVVTLLKGNRIGAIRCGDSLLNPMSEMKYDRIVCEPPFMPRYSEGYMFLVPQDNYVYQDISNAESLALRHMLAHLKEDGIATVIVPMGMLFKSGRMAEVRALLVENNIDAVIELPPGIWMNTGVATALLVLKKNKTDDSIYMINAKDFFDKVAKMQLRLSGGNVARIVDLYKNRETMEGVSRNVVIKEIAENGYNLCTTQYVTLTPEDTITIEDTSYYMQKYVQLADQLAEIDKQLGAVRGRFTKEA